MLKEYYDKTFVVGGRYRLNMNMENLGVACAYELNKCIKNINKENKYKLAATNLVNVDELIGCPYWNGEGTRPDHCHYVTILGELRHWDAATGIDEAWEVDNGNRLLPADQLLVEGKGELVLNIAKISAEANKKIDKIGDATTWSPVRNDLAKYTRVGKDQVLMVSDNNLSFVSTAIREDFAGVGSDNAKDIKSVKISMPAGWVVESDAPNKALLSDLPDYDVIFAANNNYFSAEQLGAQYLDIFAHGSKTKWVSGNELETLKSGDDNEMVTVLKNNTKAAISVVNGIRFLEVMDKTIGDVYVYDGDGEKVEINDTLKVSTIEGINVRVDNSLVNNVFYHETSKKMNYLISTAGAAYRMVGNLDKTPSIQTTPLNAKKVNQLTLLSYWTGQALDAEATNVKKYDTGVIYTVAQLASMGEKIAESTTNKYIINDYLEDMWLGGSVYPWIGPKVTVTGFEFDGNFVALKKMQMPLYVKGAFKDDNTYKQPIYVYDPHLCCTSCGFKQDVLDWNTTDDSKQGEELTSWGLIRSILSDGSEANVIKNVALNNVYAEPKDKDGKNIPVTDKIGAIVGWVNIGSAPIDFDYIKVGEIQIWTEDNNIGGIGGLIEKAGKVTVLDTEVGNTDAYRFNTGEIRGRANVGGIFGKLNATGLDMERILVQLGTHIGAAGNHLGGLVGLANIEGEAQTTPAPGRRALATEAITIDEATVKTHELLEKGSYVGGLFGNYTSKNLDLNVTNASIIMDKQIRALKDYNGGLFGKLLLEGDDNKVTFTNNNVEVKNFRGVNYVAGNVGYFEAPNALIQEAVVTVPDSVRATEKYAAGLVAYNKIPGTLAIETAAIEIGKLYAGDAFAGGEVAYSYEGTIEVGKNFTDHNTYPTTITIGSIESFYNAGGVIGNNDNLADVYLFTGYRSDNESGLNTCTIDIAVGAFKNTKGEGTKDLKDIYATYASESDSHKSATFSNVAGRVDGHLYINEKLLTVADKLNGVMKEKIGYMCHPTQKHTDINKERFFWGDSNGYVGWGKSGNYFLSNGKNADIKDAKNKVAGDQENGFNYYLIEDSYYNTNSKNYVED
jgi:hypothetical protein